MANRWSCLAFPSSEWHVHLIPFWFLLERLGIIFCMIRVFKPGEREEREVDKVDRQISRKSSWGGQVNMAFMSVVSKKWRSFMDNYPKSQILLPADYCMFYRTFSQPWEVGSLNTVGPVRSLRLSLLQVFVVVINDWLLYYFILTIVLLSRSVATWFNFI